MLFSEIGRPNCTDPQRVTERRLLYASSYRTRRGIVNELFHERRRLRPTLRARRRHEPAQQQPSAHDRCVVDLPESSEHRDDIAD